MDLKNLKMCSNRTPWGFVRNLRTFDFKSLSRWKFDDFSFDPRVRHSVWSCVVGGTLGLWLGVYGVNQSNVQRYVSCRTVKEASKAVWINCFALIMINFTAASSGLVMFAYYNGCDPMQAGWIKVIFPPTQITTTIRILNYP